MNARRILVGFGVVVLAAAAAYLVRPWSAAARAAAVEFDEGLSGPTTPYLDIPFDKYTFTPEGLRRTTSASGRLNGVDRPVIRTRSDRYLTRDFIAEVDIVIPPDVEDLVFVGVGDGRSAPRYNEPSGSFGFRIHHLPENRDVRFSASAPESEIHVLQEILGTLPSEGTLTVRLERTGDTLTASIPGTPGSARTIRMSEYPTVLTSGHGFLYLSNTAEGTTFRNFRVRLLP